MPVTIVFRRDVTMIELKKWLMELEWCPHCFHIDDNPTNHLCEHCNERVVQMEDIPENIVDMIIEKVRTR